MAFTGIPLEALDFYEDLENDNSKSFWVAHKEVYERCVRAPLEALAQELAPEFGAGKLFRPYRDVRFSKDRTPYKTHQGVYFADSALYLHVFAGGLMVAGGYWHTDAAQVARLRSAVADDMTGPQLRRTIQAVEAARITVHGEQLTRVPAGYSKDHPRADLLRYKSLTGQREFGSPGWLTTRRTRTEVGRAWRSLSPLIGWLDHHVGRSTQSRG
ncbi:MAG: DUF2461 domain-containing protein [Actinomycetota bacterium]